MREILLACRPSQWAKNLLVFVPWLAAHGPFDRVHAARALAAFGAFTLVASAVYLANDVRDRHADAGHPAKRTRAIASGRLPIPTALRAAGLLLVGGLALAFSSLPTTAALLVCLYVVLAGAYGLVLKRVLLLDVFALSALYGVRLLAGGESTGTPLSPWLVALSGFLFLSLAFLKRYGELRLLELGPTERIPGRGWRGSDLDLVRVVGPACGIVAALVLTLYVQGDQVRLLYRHPAWLWLAVPPLLYWVLRLWILAHRGSLKDDPVAFALRDAASYGALALILMAGVLAGPLR